MALSTTTSTPSPRSRRHRRARLRTSRPTYAIDATHFEANAGPSTPSTRRRLHDRRSTAVGWAVLLVSTSVEVCVARERARGPESRRSRRQACRALFHKAWRLQRCVRARFGRILTAMRFLRFSPRDGACFAACLARCGCGLRSLVLAVFRTRQQIFDPVARVKSGNSRVKFRISGFVKNLFRKPRAAPIALLSYRVHTRESTPGYVATWSSEFFADSVLGMILIYINNRGTA